MLKVEFTSDYASHKSGDVVALEDSKANRYILFGLAKLHSESKQAPKVTEDGKPEVVETVVETKQTPKTKTSKKK